MARTNTNTGGGGGGGITSINGNSNAAQTIAPGQGIGVNSAGGTTTITSLGDFDGRVDFNGNKMTDADLTARGTIPLNTLKFEANTNLLTTATFLPGLTQLRQIQLGDNLFTGFAENLTTLPDLIILDVSRNPLMTSFTANLTGLTNLEVLAVNESALTSFTTNLSTLTSLEFLYLQANQLTTFTSDLSSSTSIIGIDISNNPGLTTFNPVLASGSTLTTLLAQDCAITSFTVPLDTYSSLIEVNLQNNAITSQAEIDQIIIDVDISANISGTMNGNLVLDGGTMGAPTAASNAAFMSLTGLGWNITTN